MEHKHPRSDAAPPVSYDLFLRRKWTALAALLRSLHSGIPFDILPQMHALVLSVLAALAIIGWSVFLYRPLKARSLVLQLLPWGFLIIRMAVPFAQLQLTRP